MCLEQWVRGQRKCAVSGNRIVDKCWSKHTKGQKNAFFFIYPTVQNNGVLYPTFEFIGLLYRHSLFSLLIVLSQPFPFLLGVDVDLCITLPHVLFGFRIHLIAVKQPVPLLSVSVEFSFVYPHPLGCFVVCMLTRLRSTIVSDSVTGLDRMS